MKLYEKYLYEASLKALAKKTIQRIESYGGNHSSNIAKITKRINAIKNIQKLVLFAMGLEDINYHEMVALCMEKYKDLTGKEMINDPLWKRYDLYELAGE